MLAVLLTALTLAPESYTATIVRGPTSATGWIEVTDDGECTWFVSLAEGCRVVWHLDERVALDRAELRPGACVRITGPSYSVASRVAVMCLGPLALAAAVEEFVAESCGDRPWTGLTAGEIATIDALGSPSWLVRESVTRSLRERGPAAMGLLFRARRSRDPEVRARAEAVLVRLGF